MASIERARLLRKEETWAEKLMWRWLRARRFCNYKFRRQHPLDRYYLDFFCEEAELNVELDGSQHGFPDQRKHDAERESSCDRAASRRCGFGIRICAEILKAFAI
jgi:very-short-patch-repair endonuclease